MRQSSGWIESPDYDLDGLYDLNMECRWFVIVNNGSVISFQILYVEIQAAVACATDFLRVTVTLHIEQKLMHELCKIIDIKMFRKKLIRAWRP